MLNRSTQQSDLLWFEHLSPVPKPSLRLFCFPYAGGSSQAFRNLRQHFPFEIDICLVHFPGRDKRIGERPLTRLKSLVEAITDAIHGKLQQPFALFGHSLGRSLVLSSLGNFVAGTASLHGSFFFPVVVLLT